MQLEFCKNDKLFHNLFSKCFDKFEKIWISASLFASFVGVLRNNRKSGIHVVLKISNNIYIVTALIKLIQIIYSLFTINLSNIRLVDYCHFYNEESLYFAELVYSLYLPFTTLRMYI